MDLMTASTSYKKLAQKYRDFRAPTLRIHVDGVEIVAKRGAKIAELSVELTAGFAASGCTFDVVGEYEAQNTAFAEKGCAALLQLGAKVELELGYIETTAVFYGLIVEVEYIFDSHRGPYIHVECMDAKCLLMKQQRLVVLRDKSLTTALGELFDEQPFSSYIKGKKIDALSSKTGMIAAAMEDDYRFAVRIAGDIGYEFFIVLGKVYLRKTPETASPIMTLSPQGGLLTHKLSLSGAALYAKTEVVGINPANNERVSGQAVASGKYGKGSGAAQMTGRTVKTVFDHAVGSADEAAARAKILMQAAQNRFGRIECRCVGLPELLPGRSVSITGISKEADRDCYILNVRHTMDERGFFTTVEARINSL